MIKKNYWWFVPWITCLAIGILLDIPFITLISIIFPLINLLKTDDKPTISRILNQ